MWVPGILLDSDVQFVFMIVIAMLIALLAYDLLGYKYTWRAALGAFFLAGAINTARTSAQYAQTIFASDMLIMPVFFLFLAGFLFAYKPVRVKQRPAVTPLGKTGRVALVVLLGLLLLGIIVLGTIPVARECEQTELGVFCDGTGIVSRDTCRAVCEEDAGMAFQSYRGDVPVDSEARGRVVVNFCYCSNDPDKVERVYVSDG